MNMNHMQNAGKSAAISWLRILATMAVVASHAWSTLTENPDMFVLTAGENTFLTIAYSLLKWAVPVFFMITGALMLRKDKEITLRDCLGKYARRVLLALIVFGVPYGVLMQIFETRTLSLSMLPEAFLMVLAGNSMSHLWYLYTLLGIYLLLPLIKVFVQHASRQVLQYVLAIMFLFNFCRPLFIGLTGLDVAFELPLDAYPLFYLLLGYYLWHEPPRWARHRLLPWAAILPACALIIAAGLMGGPLDVLMSYSSPVAVVLSAGIFLLARHMVKPGTPWLWMLDRLCFGVYLIHPLFIQFMYKFLKLTPAGTPWYPALALVYAALFVLLGFAASWVTSLFKPLKKYVL